MKLMTCSLLLCASMVALAQQPATGVIVGTVRDASGTVLPGATVSARSAAEGAIAATTVTSAAGSYSFSLAPGRYLLRASLPGFSDSLTVVTAVSASRIDASLTMQVAPPGERPPEFAPPPLRRSEVDIRADSQTREGNVIRYRGNVRMRTNGSEITADEIDFNVDTRTADVRGNVQVRVIPTEYRVIPLTQR